MIFFYRYEQVSNVNSIVNAIGKKVFTNELYAKVIPFMNEMNILIKRLTKINKLRIFNYLLEIYNIQMMHVMYRKAQNIQK